jgi:tetratricopeptide (TPR) repeat protein
MLKQNLLFAFLFLSPVLTGQKASITVESRDILTYPFSDPDPVPILAEGREEIYPYFSFSGYSLKGQMQKWKVIKLENDYIEVYVLPSDGGKVWGAIEKSTGKEFIYRNEVMKYRNISMRGPWTSGGIEFNFGYIGHHPSTCVPVDYKTVENADGSVSCFVGSMDLPSRTKWTVEIRVPNDRAYFETRAMWSNPSPLPQTYYNWMTAAAVVTDDLEFSYPGNNELEHSGEAGPWPVDKQGRDLSMYANNAFGSDRSAHIVGEYNDFMGGYYHKSNFGFGHWSLYDEMPGHKLWLWSQARSGGIWEDLLTDTDGQYMEFQAGRMFNQYGGTSAFKTPISQTPFVPGLTDWWREIWFPVKEIGGLTDVSPMGVLSTKYENGKLQVGINSLSFAQAKVIVRSDGKVVFTEDRKFKPMDVYKTSVPLSAGADYEVVVEGMDLQFSPSKRKLLSRPFYSTLQTDIITAASLYQEGNQLKEERVYRQAKELYKKCLQKDPLYIDAMAALTEIYYRSNQYDSALYYANNALQLDTYHPAANYFAGVTYRAQGNLTDALESFGWAARTQEYRSMAYALMAGIELQLGNRELTEHYANLSLNYNSTNFTALEVLAILYRKSGETALADKYIETISKLDPLNHFADFERNIVHPSDDNYSRFTSSIMNELPYQTYLELSMIYYGFGLKDDAYLVLDKAPSQPEIGLWKAWLKGDPAMLNEVAVASPAYVFPYRTESVPVLKWAVSQNPVWKFKYYLALNYLAIQRNADAMQLFQTCGQEPDYAPFYLARAALLRPKNEKQELLDLQTAHSLAPDDWRAIYRLIDYYDSHQDYKMTLSLSGEAVKKHGDNPAIGVQYAIALINNGQYAKSLKKLESMNILPSEGARQGKTIFEQACLFLSIDLIKNRKYSEAMKMTEKSKEWPENLKLLKETGETEAANTLIQKIEKSGGLENPVNQWVIAAYKNDQTRVNDLEKAFANNNYFLIAKKISELK